MPEWLGRLLGVVGSACLVWTALLIVPPAPAAQAAVTFSDATSFAMGTQPTSVAVADFDDDGNVDVVTANAGSDNVSVRLGDGAGGFGAASTYTVGTSPQWVAIDQFNADTSLDLAVANVGSDNVSILLGTGTGSFGPLHASTLDTRGPRHHVGHRDADAEEVEGLSC